VVERFGGSVPAEGLWEGMKGFSAAKEILDRRVVAPLAHTELADRLGLVPPAAVLLFAVAPLVQQRWVGVVEDLLRKGTHLHKVVEEAPRVAVALRVDGDLHLRALPADEAPPT